MNEIKMALLTIAMFTLTSCYDFLNPVFTAKDAEPLIDNGKYVVNLSKNFMDAMKEIDKMEKKSGQSKNIKSGKIMDANFSINSDNTYKLIAEDADTKKIIERTVITKNIFDNIFAYQILEEKNGAEINKIYLGEKNKKGFVFYMFDFEKAGELIQKYKLREVKKINGKKVDMVYDGDKEQIIAFFKAHKNLERTPMMVFEKSN